MADRLRVAMVIPRYHPVFGGAENQCRLLCKELRDAELAEIPWILTMRLAADTPARETVDGIPVFRVGPSGISRWSHYGFLARAFLSLVAKRHEYDLIHCHASAITGAMAALGGLLVRRPVVVKISTNGELLNRRPEVNVSWVRRAMDLLLRRPIVWLNARHAHLAVLNREGQTEALAAGAKHVETIDNGVDTKIFHPATPQTRTRLRAQFGVPEGSLVLLFTGRFVHRKGVQLLADAFLGLRANVATSQPLLLLAGSDELQSDSAADAIHALAGVSGGRVRILPPEVPPTPYLWLADVFVLPSTREGMPNSLLEAIAAGLPCIVSDISPHREVAMRNPAAHIAFFRTGDKADLARVLSEHVANPPRYHPATQSLLSPDFSISNVAQRYAQLYMQVAEFSR